MKTGSSPLIITDTNLATCLAIRIYYKNSENICFYIYFVFSIDDISFNRYIGIIEINYSAFAKRQEFLSLVIIFCRKIFHVKFNITLYLV